MLPPGRWPCINRIDFTSIPLGISVAPINCLKISVLFPCTLQTGVWSHQYGKHRLIRHPQSRKLTVRVGAVNFGGKGELTWQDPFVVRVPMVTTAEAGRRLGDISKRCHLERDYCLLSMVHSPLFIFF